MRIGSLFSGAGGLDLAVLELFPGSSLAWHSEINPAAAEVLDYRWPGVPNLGDIEWVGLDFTASELTLIAEAMTVARDNPAQTLPLRPLESDWSGVEPVDVITAGFPCQDVSAAGRRAGLRRGTRTGLWHQVTRAIAQLRPRMVLLENVTGLLSADGDEWPESLKVLHAESSRWARVESLIDNKIAKASKKGRFSGEWEHRKRQERIRSSRLRIRILAEFRRERSRLVQRAIATVLGDLAALGFDAEWTCVRAADVGACHRRERIFILAYPADSDRARSQGSSESAGTNTAGASTDSWGRHSAGRDREAVALLPTPRASDGTKGGPNQRGSSGDLMLPSAVVQLLPTPRASDGSGGPNPLERAERMDDVETRVIRLGDQWGDYAPAIARQESMSRPAPAPTELSVKGNPRLSPAFAEWLMFWPAGWVTDPAIGLSRNDQLRCIGNGVVPRQAVFAFRQLLSHLSEGIAS